MKRSLATSCLAGLLLLSLSGIIYISWSLRAATTSYGQGNYPAAVAIWRRLSYLFPGSAGIAFNSGVAYYRQGDYRRATAEFSRAVRGKDPAVAAAARYNLGNTLVRQGDALVAGDSSGAAELYGKAAEQYEQALQLHGADPDARFNLAVARDRLRTMRHDPRGQHGPHRGPGSNNREHGRSEERRDQGRPAAGKQDAAETRRGATGDHPRSRGAAGAGGKTGTGVQPLSMSRQDAAALLREHAGTGGATAIFRDAGQKDHAAPVLKDW